jgi:hypothetical protein
MCFLFLISSVFFAPLFTSTVGLRHATAAKIMEDACIADYMSKTSCGSVKVLQVLQLYLKMFALKAQVRPNPSLLALYTPTAVLTAVISISSATIPKGIHGGDIAVVLDGAGGDDQSCGRQ